MRYRGLGDGVGSAQVDLGRLGQVPGLGAEEGARQRAADIVQHVRPGLGQGDRDGRADSPASTGDQGGLAGNAEWVQDHRPRLSVG